MPDAPFLTVAEVAAQLHVSVRTLRGLVAKHKPPVTAAGRQILFGVGMRHG